MSEHDDARTGDGPAARHLVVYGRVQGVFFRGSTRELAEEAGVAGWVTNLDDGTVEAWLEGDPGAVAGLETWIRDGGPPFAQVTRVTAQDVAARGYDAFEVVEG